MGAKTGVDGLYMVQCQHGDMILCHQRDGGRYMWDTWPVITDYKLLEEENHLEAEGLCCCCGGCCCTTTIVAGSSAAVPGVTGGLRHRWFGYSGSPTGGTIIGEGLGGCLERDTTGNLKDWGARAVSRRFCKVGASIYGAGFYSQSSWCQESKTMRLQFDVPKRKRQIDGSPLCPHLLPVATVKRANEHRNADPMEDIPQVPDPWVLEGFLGWSLRHKSYRRGKRAKKFECRCSRIWTSTEVSDGIAGGGDVILSLVGQRQKHTGHVALAALPTDPGFPPLPFAALRSISSTDKEPLLERLEERERERLRPRWFAYSGSRQQVAR
ncbi:hypothetical protein F5887DRAFT_922482 [Amanita rubescens]|nr:hypothetical protein F5887DRAFT_922482 [Amanita rubescens]